MVHPKFSQFEVSFDVFVQLLSDVFKKFNLSKQFVELYSLSYKKLFDSSLNKFGGFVCIDNQPLCVFDDYFCDETCVLVPIMCNFGAYMCQSNTHEFLSLKDKFNLQQITTSFPIVDLSSWKDVIINDRVIRDYIKCNVSNNFIPHCFGTKSKKVKWEVVFADNDDNATYLLNVFSNLTNLIHHQSQSIKSQTNNPIELFRAENLSDFFYYNKECLSPSVGAVIAHDDTDIVCVMQLYKFGLTLVCDTIVFNHDPCYKPYSLASMAHLQSIIYAMKQSLNHVDLGVNFSSLGDYKKVFNYIDTSLPTYIFKR